MQKLLIPPTLFALFIIPFLTQAQNPNELYAQYKAKYSDKMAVVLEKTEDVLIDFENDTVGISHVEYEDILLLTDQASMLANQKAYESYFSKVDKIEALTLVPNGKRYKKMEVKHFKRKKESSSGIFYDDLESINFIMPNLSPKARTQVRIAQSIKDPRFLNAFYINTYAPVERTQLRVKAHKNIKLAYKLFNIDEKDIKFEKTQKGNYITYTWTAKDVEEFKSESSAPKRNYFSPHIVYYITEIEYPNKTQKLATDVADLYNWYSSLACQVNLKNDESLKKVVDELIKDCKTEKEKVKNIFYWVQDNIKYVAFEDGMQGFIPSEASLVFEKRYGDCKGMSSIIHKMLNMAGIKNSYLTWIGARNLPYKYSDIPTPIVDNHMIVTYEPKKGEYIYLDATDSYLPFGFPSSMIQGKEALLGVDRNTHKVALVPIIDAKENQTTDSVSLKIENNTLIGKGFYSTNGYTKGYASYRLDGLSKENEERTIRSWFTKGNNKFSVKNYDIQNLNDKDKPLHINYDFELADYAKVIGDEIYVNLNLEKPFENDEIDIEKRKAPIENDYLYEISNVVRLEIPEGYELTYLPENSTFENELFGYSINYQNEGTYILLKNTYYEKALLVESDAFEEWNKMVKQISKAYRESIILKKK